MHIYTYDVLRRYVDPTLEECIQSRTRPWAFSPFLSTMPHIHHTRVESAHHHPPPLFPASDEVIADRTTDLRTRHGTHVKHPIPQHRKQRKAHFKSSSRRKEVAFGPNVIPHAPLFCCYVTHLSCHRSIGHHKR